MASASAGAASMPGCAALGHCRALGHCGITVVVVSHRVQCVDPVFF
jgi:hypothetical protein